MPPASPLNHTWAPRRPTYAAPWHEVTELPICVCTSRCIIFLPEGEPQHAETDLRENQRTTHWFGSDCDNNLIFLCSWEVLESLIATLWVTGRYRSIDDFYIKVSKKTVDVGFLFLNKNQSKRKEGRRRSSKFSLSVSFLFLYFLYFVFLS